MQVLQKYLLQTISPSERKLIKNAKQKQMFKDFFIKTQKIKSYLVLNSIG